jgi:hypothetical protein
MLTNAIPKLKVIKRVTDLTLLLHLHPLGLRRRPGVLLRLIKTEQAEESLAGTSRRTRSRRWG